MAEFLREAVIGVLCIYVLASTPFLVYLAFRAMFNLVMALKNRAAHASWLNPSSWVTRHGYTREGFEDLTGFAADVRMGLLALTPWGLLLYLAGQ